MPFSEAMLAESCRSPENRLSGFCSSGGESFFILLLAAEEGSSLDPSCPDPTLRFFCDLMLPVDIFFYTASLSGKSADGDRKMSLGFSLSISV